MSNPDWWWDKAWNPVGGCNYISAGCKNCFAPAWNKSHPHRDDIHRDVRKEVKGREVFNGELSVFRDGHAGWTFPLKWPGAEHPKLGPGKPSLLFIADLSDLFEDRPKEILDRVLATVVMSPHIGLVCTKRTQRCAEYFAALDPRTAQRWRPKLWLGFSAENQEWFDKRWADMRPLAAAGWPVFVSVAPMLGSVTLPPDFLAHGAWAIASGEQRIPRTRTRAMHPDWARALRDQCKAANIPFFMKQMSHGRPIPPDLQIRAFPQNRT
jgi:protein gp37